MPNYIVYFGDIEREQIRYVEAVNEEAAKKKYLNYCLENLCKDTVSFDHIYGRTSNFSFAERFLSECFDEDGNRLTSDEDTDRIFKANVRSYLSEPYAQIYIDYFLNKDIEDGEVTFPEEMLQFIYLDYLGEPTAINLEDIKI